MATAWRCKTASQQKLVIQKLGPKEYAEKIEHDGKSDIIPEAASSNHLVQLRRHHHQQKHAFWREEVVASVRLSLCHSQLINPEDEVFRQFIIDRLAEADQDTCVPPFDCLHIYAFEGTGSLAGSLSSVDSSFLDPYFKSP